MIEFLVNIDTKLFLFLNGMHNSFFDFIMYWLSDKLIWIPLYLFLIYLIAKNYGKKTWIILLYIVLLILLADQGSRLMKMFIERPRPCHDLGELVHTINGKCGGKFGFFSSHASNCFALATFVSFLLKRFYPIFKYVLFIWAALVSYSRIYVGVHYPGDVICGTIYGILVGWLVIAIYKRIQKFKCSQIKN